MDAHTITLPSKPPLPPVRLFLHGGLSCRPRGRAPACWRGVGRSASSHHHTIIISSSSNLASEILVLLPLHTTPLGYGCLGVQQRRRRRSNEICHGEIPTFLIEHTATPIHPLFLPLGRQRVCWVAAGQPAVGLQLDRSCSMQGAAAAAVAEPEPAPAPAPQPALAGEYDRRSSFPLLPHPPQNPPPPAASSLSSRSESAFPSSGVELHGV